jgi:hypothetical protein
MASFQDLAEYVLIILSGRTVVAAKVEELTLNHLVVPFSDFLQPYFLEESL